MIFIPDSSLPNLNIIPDFVPEYNKVRELSIRYRITSRRLPTHPFKLTGLKFSLPESVTTSSLSSDALSQESRPGTTQWGKMPVQFGGLLRGLLQSEVQGETHR